jgi:hypothetical protein
MILHNQIANLKHFSIYTFPRGGVYGKCIWDSKNI